MPPIRFTCGLRSHPPLYSRIKIKQEAVELAAAGTADIDYVPLEEQRDSLADFATTLASIAADTATDNLSLAEDSLADLATALGSLADDDELLVLAAATGCLAGLDLAPSQPDENNDITTTIAPTGSNTQSAAPQPQPTRAGIIPIDPFGDSSDEDDDDDAVVLLSPSCSKDARKFRPGHETPEEYNTRMRDLLQDHEAAVKRAWFESLDSRGKDEAIRQYERRKALVVGGRNFGRKPKTPKKNKKK